MLEAPQLFAPMSQYVLHFCWVSLQQNQANLKSQVLELWGVGVKLIIPTAVELSGWSGDGGCSHPISYRVFLSGTISFAVKNSVVISASAADNTTYFMICAMVSVLGHSISECCCSLTRICGYLLCFLILICWWSLYQSGQQALCYLLCKWFCC